MKTRRAAVDPQVRRPVRPTPPATRRLTQPVPGAYGYRLDRDVRHAGLTWTPADAAITPIGAALAHELAGRKGGVS